MSSTGFRGNKPAKSQVGRRVRKPRRKSQSGLIREGIFGVNDGLVATIGLVSGEALSHQGHGAILIAGLSSVGAAIVSMAVGSYLATQSENDFMRKEVSEQARAIRHFPHRERHHVERLLDEIGIPSPNIRPSTRRITSSRPRWVGFMARENLGIHANRAETPLKNSMVMAIAVLFGSSPPIIPYLLPLSVPLARNISWVASLLAALTLGTLKAVFTRTPLVKSAISFAVLVSLSALVGALIGFGLGTIGA